MHALVIDSVVAGLRTFVFMVPAAAVAASLARRARDLSLGVAVLALAAATDRAFSRGREETSCGS